jgi:hypothetical protein
MEKLNNEKTELNKLYDIIQEGNTQLADSKLNKSIISTEEKELCIFLYTIFQYYLEKANEMMNQEDLEKKEKGKKILLSLLDNSFINHFKTNKIIFACINGILNFYLGLANFSNEDQSLCESSMLKALDFFNTLPTGIKLRYINIYQELYNNLGIVFYNKGEIKKGLQYLGKAEQMYKIFNDLTGIVYTNSFSQFMQNCAKESNKTNDSSVTDKLEFFNFYIDGGLNKKSFEQNYTLTIFYYAQAFTKLNFRKKAIKYCSLTLKRQIEFNEYDLKDAIVNCINLSDFYIENQHFAQAEYILIAATTLLPEDPNKKKKLRAGIQMQLGKYFLERLKFAVRQTREQVWISDNEELFQVTNKRIVIFVTLNIVWPKIEDIKDIEQAKLLFRLANTQYKKALEFYKIDGYVTEHIQISRDISQLYKYLTFFETDNKRIFAMFERRISLLEPILNQINPKVFVTQWQVISSFKIFFRSSV